jgi:hypothetical protein
MTSFTYRTPAADDPIVKLNDVLSHFPGFGVNVLAMSFSEGRYTLALDAELLPEHIEHLELEVL